jgi:hypothetical protein
MFLETIVQVEPSEPGHWMDRETPNQVNWAGLAKNEMGRVDGLCRTDMKPYWTGLRLDPVSVD